MKTKRQHEMKEFMWQPFGREGKKMCNRCEKGNKERDFRDFFFKVEKINVGFKNWALQALLNDDI